MTFTTHKPRIRPLTLWQWLILGSWRVHITSQFSHYLTILAQIWSIYGWIGRVIGTNITIHILGIFRPTVLIVSLLIVPDKWCVCVVVTMLILLGQ